MVCRIFTTVLEASWLTYGGMGGDSGGQQSGGYGGDSGGQQSGGYGGGSGGQQSGGYGGDSGGQQSGGYGGDSGGQQSGMGSGGKSACCHDVVYHSNLTQMIVAGMGEETRAREDSSLPVAAVWRVRPRTFSRRSFDHCS